MNVRELIERLDEMDQDAEVWLATQPNWPLQFELAGATSAAEIAGEQQCDEHGDYSCDDCAAGDNVVYLVEGDHPDQPYAPRGAWQAVGH